MGIVNYTKNKLIPHTINHPIIALLKKTISDTYAEAEAGRGGGYAPSILREEKARKIEIVSAEAIGQPIRNKNICDVGSGNGEIAQYFAKIGNHVTACDVQEPSVENRKFSFSTLDSAQLPFSAEQFDIVIYNGVMEHLQKPSDQITQLREIYRILKSGGICYILQPNRYFPFEGHYLVWFLHWLPNCIFFRLMKATGKYAEDVYLRGYFKLKKMFREAGFNYEEYTAKIIANPERYGMNILTGRTRGGGVLQILQCLSPTLIFILRK